MIRPASHERSPAPTTLAAAFALGIATIVAPGVAHAQRIHVPVWEWTTSIGVADRSTTGVGAPLTGYGYAAATAPIVDLETRVMAPLGHDYFHHGVLARGTYVPSGDIVGPDYAFRQGVFDLAYVFRTELPCMHRGSRQWFVSGYVGATVAIADAGTGTAPASDRSNLNIRTQAAADLDHVGVGWVVGVNFDMRVGAFVVGPAVALRQFFVVGNPTIAREWLPTLALRIGFDAQIGAPPRPDVWGVRGL